MTFDYDKIAERYKKTPAEVKAKVEAYAAKVKAELADFYKPDVIDAEVEKIVVGNISNLFQLSGLEYAKDQYERGNIKKANVIVLGVSPSEDRNSYEKWLAREAYKADPNGALVAKKVRLQKTESGKEYPVPLDSRPTITRKDENGVAVEVENPDFGKDLPEILKVSVPTIVCGWIPNKGDVEAVEDFYMGTMAWDNDLKNQPDIGKKSTIYGRINGKYLTIFKDAYEGSEVYEKAYDVAMRVLPSTDIWMDLSVLNDMPIQEVVDGKRKSLYTKFAVKGTVQKCDVKPMKSQYTGRSYHKAELRIGDSEVVSGIKLGSTYAPLTAYIDENVVENDEVIVLGVKKSFAKKDDQGNYVKDADGNSVMLPYYEMWGCIKAFSSDHDKVIARLKEKGLI